MKITKKQDNDTLTIAVEGRINTTTAHEFETEVDKSINEYSSLIFDFKDLSYISSAGLRVLLGAKKAMGEGEMKVINLNETIKEIFEVTGFSLILDVE